MMKKPDMHKLRHRRKQYTDGEKHTNKQTLSLPHPVYTTNTLKMWNTDQMAGKTFSLSLKHSSSWYLELFLFLIVLFITHLPFAVICSLSLCQYTSASKTSMTAKTHATNLRSCVFSPAPHGEIRYGIKIWAKHFGIFEELVSKCVQSVQRDENIRGRHPVLRREREK